ncbi:hypothetical protein [uncultured Roseobacter sp.]|uniref:hypothetical protein n=1 Tax=uncultured Roseobacter sp. TaxID=114847 RepID=UPI00263741CE|nr:hypothetical protein [uncultured Roseobacter sp.]
MKMLVHRIEENAALPFDLDQLKLHLRVSEDAEDAAIQNIGLRAAAELEQFAQIALITQTIRGTIFDPPREYGLRLPSGATSSPPALLRATYLHMRCGHVM